MPVALLESNGAPVVPELFLATSDAFVVKSQSVDAAPNGEGWVLAGAAEAASWGAPALAGSSRYYCADQALFDRHRLRHGTHESRVQVAIAHTPLVIADRKSVDSGTTVYDSLDLAGWRIMNKTQQNMPHINYLTPLP